MNKQGPVNQSKNRQMYASGGLIICLHISSRALAIAVLVRGIKGFHSTRLAASQV